jgi:hypothetical protein
MSAIGKINDEYKAGQTNAASDLTCQLCSLLHSLAYNALENEDPAPAA